MRIIWFTAALAISGSTALRSEIHDVLKNADIEASLAKVNGISTVYQRPNFSISLGAQAGAGALETHDAMDEVLFIRRGSGSLQLGDHKYEIGAGDVINIKRKTAHRIAAPSGRIEYVAVRIAAEGAGKPASGIRPGPRTMPDVLRGSEIAETFAKFDANQPIHSAPNFTMNYVIYSGHAGPFEVHRGCADIYFLKIGTANAQLGGQIRNAKEESPGEPRGDGVDGARRYSIGPGDIVLIPRNTTHHMDPTSAKLGYVLLKVWGGMTAAELLIQDLQERGVQWMATLCGHGLDPLYQAARKAGMRLVDTRNEQTASYIAESAGRLTRQPGVCAVSSGIALVNALTGVANAWFDRSPMLLISGAAATATAGMGHFQDMDQATLARPITKFSRSIDCAARVRDILAEALGVATADPPGPVHLEFPMDIQNTEVSEGELVPPAAFTQRRGPVDADPGEVAHALAASSKPVVIAGSGVFYRAAGPQMLRFCEELRIPVLTPIWDRGSVDRPSPVFLGVIGAATGGPSYLREADCVLMAGAEVDYRLSYLRPPGVRSDARILPFSGGWDELAAGCRSQGVTAPEAWLASCVRRRDEFRRGIEHRADAAAGDTMHAVDVIRAIRDVLTEDPVLLIDGGNIGQWAHQLLCSDRYPGHWLTCGRSGVVGWGVGGAMAARLAYPERPVILLSGDGAFTFNIADLESAARQNLPFVAIVADDQGWGITRSGHVRQFGAPIASSLGPIAFDRLADSLGCRGVRAETPAELARALREAMNSAAVTVIHAPISAGGPTHMRRSTLAVGLLFAALAPAQEFRGTFSGTITDVQGAAIAKAKIVATETRTGAKSDTVSESSGAYTIPFLAPGDYEIAVEAPGFKRSLRQGMTLGMGEHPVIDIRMEVGAVTEAVTVTVDASLIEAANASLGQVITAEEVEDFPVNGRTPLMLGQLALGAIPTIEAGVQVRPFDNNTPASFSLGGASSGTNELLYNGAPNAAFTNQIAYSPPQDAVREVRVSAFESDAGFGHTGGGTANQITKQGGNGFHGALYEFNQVSALAANQFFYNKESIPKPAYRYNQYGVTASGPVWVPKVFNGKNKVFWLFAWEGLHDSDPSNSPRETSNPTNLATVPTDAERKGDFSALLKANTAGTDYTIYDPATGVVSTTHVARTPFPNNVIPASRLNPIALNYMQYYPQPNTAGQINGFQNFDVTAVSANGYDNELARLDLNLSDRNKLSADFRHSYRLSGDEPGGSNNYLGTLGTGAYLHRKNQGASLDDVYTITPTMVMDIRGNWTRFFQDHTSPTDGMDPTKLGFPSYIAANSEGLLLPNIVLSSTSVTAGSEESFQSLGVTSNDRNTYDIYQLFGDVVDVRGNHTIKVGADVRDYRWSAFTFGDSAGEYTFNSNWTNGPLNNAAAAPLGQDFAAFLLGLPSSGQIALNAQSTTGSKYYGFFVQDDWRARSNLTLNIGLRMEHETPTVERFNRVVDGFSPTAQNPISAAAAAAYAASPVPQIPAGQFNTLGGLTFAGPGNPNIYHTGSIFASPRVGFAWTPGVLGPGTVIRGGFGIFVVPIVINGNGETSATTTLNQEGFSQTTQVVATNNNYLTPAATLSDPFPNGIAQPTGSSGGTGTFLGQQVTYFDPQAKHPYDMRWNIGIQRELPGQMVLEVVYIGNHGVHLPVTTQLDYIPRQYLSASPARSASTINLLTGAVANPFKGLLPNSSSLNGSTVPLDQLLIPFPQYPVPGPPSSTSNGVVMQANTPGSSYFQSLDVRLQKRLTNGLTLINNFVWSQWIDRLAYLNDSDPAPEKRPSTDSRPLREVLAATYDLPIGRNHRLDLGSRAGNALLGGWKLNGMLTLQSGPVIGTWGNVIYLGGPLDLQPHQPNGVAFNTSQFVTASSLQLSDNIRTFDSQFGNLRRDPTKNVDMSLSKNFMLGERKYLQLRFETFNTTNRVTFGAPNISPTSTAFGTISTQVNSPRAVQLGARLVW